jgi:hypothetical protein
MPGLRQHLVTEIARTLRDRYHSGFPILKELIQNADDAEASRIIFGHHAGFEASAEHPLLCGPALWVFNDGKFKKSDATAIEYFGINTKAGDDTAIGKFGLGMKSVFHLCEAFFYLAFDGQEIHKRILNPWYSDLSEEGFHNKWEIISDSEWQNLHELAQNHSESSNSWFLMWIPLRKAIHKRDDYGNEVGAIVDRFPGDPGSNQLQFLSDVSLEKSLGCILPLLKHLHVIQHVGDDVFPGFKIRIGSQEDNRLDHKSPSLRVSGTIIGANSNQTVIKFSGVQVCPYEPEPLAVCFEQIRALNAWPKSFRLNEQRHFEQVSDKSRAEATVVLQSIEGETGKLTLDWAVFLPVEEGENTYRVNIPELSCHYSFILHGQFFVDAGRRGINGYTNLYEKCQQTVADDIDESELAVTWNQLLAQKLVLPSVLVALRDFVARTRMSDDEVFWLTEAIQRARSESGQFFFEKYRSYICQVHSWVCAMTETGRRWELIPTSSGLRLLPLPKAPNDEPQRPWHVLPGLGKIANAIFIDASKPRLSLTDAIWDESSLASALNFASNNDIIKTFGTQTGLEYFANFLELEARRYIGVQSTQNILFSLIQRALRSIPLAEIRKNRERFRSVVQHLHKDRRIAIGTVDPNAMKAVAQKTFSELFAIDTETILLPKDLDPDGQNASSAEPSDTDLTAWLKVIDRLVSMDTGSRNVDRLLDTAEYILKLRTSDSDRVVLLKVNQDLRVIRARCPRTEKQVASNLTTLLSLYHRSNLFLFSSGTSVRERLGLVPLIAQALPEESLLVIDSDIGKILRESGAGMILQSASPSDALQCLGLKGGAKILGAEVDRLALIKKTCEGIKNTDTCRGLRYLLHGSSEHFQEDTMPLWIEPNHSSSPWVKAWRMIDQSQWNVLSSTLANSIPRAQWEDIGIKAVDPMEVIGRLGQIDDLSVINAVDFSEEERDIILGTIEDDKLWYALPLHADVQGALGSIGNRCYFQTELVIPEEISEHCRVITISNDAGHREKQQRFLRPFDANAVIETVLFCEPPADHWKLILDQLVSVPPRELVPSLVDRLRKIKWLPLLHNGRAICPADIIDLPDLADEIDRLGSLVKYCYCGLNSIHESVRSHPGFDNLRCLFSKGTEAAKQIGLLLGEIDGYHVGSLRQLGETDLQDILPFVDQLGMSGWSAIKRLCAAFDEGTICSEILPNILKPIPISKVGGALDELSTLPDDSIERIAVFFRYLELLPTYPREEAINQLRNIRLPTKDRYWRSAGKICDGAVGIVHSCLIDPQVSRILGDLVVSVGNRTDSSLDVETESVGFDLMVSEASDIVADYFESWEFLVRHPAVGAFIATLGAQFRALADKWLQSHSVDWIYDSLNWQVPGARDDGARGWMQGVSAAEAFGLLKVGIREIQGNSIFVPNIFGDIIEVPLESEIKNLVAGGLYWKGGYSVEIRIRKIANLNERSPSELSAILQNSTTYILREAYAQRLPDLRNLWEQLEESDQLELSVARALILDNLPIVLRQIGAQKKNPSLDLALKHYDKARRAKAEYEQSGKETLHNDDSLNVALRKSLDELATTLTDNPEVQTGVLSAVRDKLRDYQYDQSGILFELFQNADDAGVELKSLISDSASAELDSDHRFVVDIGERILRVCHWGRPINYCPPGTEDSRADDFRRDLEKMLILSASDKSAAEGVTGKFGLGFKSVLLASDSPRILSGDLKFEIIGGVLPEKWRDSSEASNILSKWSPENRWQGTLTEIPLNESTNIEQVTERFASLAGLQAIFARTIRDIRIAGIAKHLPCGRWKPDSTMGLFETGNVDVPKPSGWSQTRVLVYRGDRGNIVIRIGSRGAEKFDGSVPSLWVMAPTRESEMLGFVVNAGFEVDAGRSRLASNSKHNKALVDRLGNDLGIALSELFSECIRDWNIVRERLNLASDVAQAEFWTSMWRTLLQKADASEAEIPKLAHRLVVAALKTLVKQTKCVPNGMDGQWARFLPHNSSWVSFPSTWWRSDVVLIELAAWPAFVKLYPASNWITDDFAGLVGEFGQHEAQKLSIKALLTYIEQRRCDPATSASLQRLYGILLKDASWLEESEARAGFANLLFLSKAGSWIHASKLVSDQLDDRDEKIIAGFAPHAHLLDDGYSGDSLEFFRRCRNVLALGIHEIAEFVLLADTNEKRLFALKYLGQGQLARDVSAMLRNRIIGSWLEYLDEYLVLFNELPHETRLEIRLRLHPESIHYTNPSFIESDEVDLLDRDDKLAKIALWWQTRGRDNHLKRFEQQFWPQNVSRNFGTDPIDRRAWMTLFGLGLTQRFGRLKDNQHRGFIQSLDSKGWWNIFCNVIPEGDGIRDWFNVLKEYGEKQIDDEEYSLWMDNFARLFRIARWLDKYVHDFRTIDQRAANEFGSLLSPAADPVFQGDDEMSAPSLVRSLRNGHSLVIRELLRTKVLSSEQAKCRAYIPSFGVRQLFVTLGYDEPQSSEEIYEILVNSGLDDPTFGGDFDIPLRILAHGEADLGTILKE